VNLLFALFTYFPHGGLTRDMLAIARACSARGHRVRVVAAESRAPPPEDIDLQILPVSALTHAAKNRRFAAQLPQAAAAFGAHLTVGFNKMPNLDVYYAADDCFAAKAARRGGLYRLTPRARQATAFERAVFGAESGAQILLIAPGQSAVFQRFYATPTSRITLLPPGICRSRIADGDDARAAARREFRREWNLTDRDILLLTVGSGFRTKGVDRAIAALAALPAPQQQRAHLIVIGRGEAARYRRQSRRLGVAARVRFTGARDDVPAFLRAADALIHPARHENTGTVLLEALVAGLPVIATANCGYARYIAQARMGRIVGGGGGDGDVVGGGGGAGRGDGALHRHPRSPHHRHPRSLLSGGDGDGDVGGDTIFEQHAFNQAVQELVECHDSMRETWRTRGRQFAATADIYDMPQHACTVIESAPTRHAGR